MPTPDPATTDWVPLWSLQGVDLSAYQTRAEKAAANGYASLDGTGKVPGTQLPDLSVYQTRTEKGAANGYASLDSGGKVPVAQLPTLAVAYGTTLPSSPADGQEAVLVDSLTNPTYQWRFRYNTANTTPYKWEFIGGSPMYARNNGMGGVSLTLPRAGVYTLAHGCDIYSATQDAIVTIWLLVNGAQQVPLQVRATGAGSPGSILSASGTSNATVTSLTVTQQNNAQVNSYSSDSWLTAIPVRV